MPRIVKQGHTVGLIAEAAVTAKRFVAFGASDNQCKLPASDNDQVIGVALNTAAAGELVDVQVEGFAVVTADGSITKGSLVAAKGTTGKAAAITVGATTGDQRVGGRAWQDADADDEISVHLAGANDYVAV